MPHPLARRPIHGTAGFDPGLDYRNDGPVGQKHSGQGTQFGPSFCRTANQSKSSANRTGGHAKGAWKHPNAKESQKSFRNSLSHLSSYRRRKEAQDALEKYVMREEQTPKERARGIAPYVAESEYIDQRGESQ